MPRGLPGEWVGRASELNGAEFGFHRFCIPPFLLIVLAPRGSMIEHRIPIFGHRALT